MHDSGTDDQLGKPAAALADYSGSQHAVLLQRAALFCQGVYGVQAKRQCTSTDTAKLCATRRSSSERRARLTLTYAQSHDGKIAGPNKRMLALSSAESMIMTHTLRVLHDAILVGIGTLLNDNPQLNARMLNPLLDGSSVPKTNLPRPVVLDGQLRTPLDSKLLVNARQGTGRRPLIVTARPANLNKMQRLCQAGADVAEVSCDADGRLLWTNILATLYETYGLRSVMIEGGATIINSVFATHSSTPLIDELIVTVAPVVVGESGLAYSAPKWLVVEAPHTFAGEDPGESSGQDSPNSAALLPIAQSCPQSFGVDNVFAWSGTVQTDG